MPRKTIIERFWERVDPDCFGTRCWNWTSTLTPGGYGMFYVSEVAERRHKAAHRFAYELLVGPIPEGLQLDHLCRVRGCVNPTHLEPVTPAENSRRAESFWSKKTHCPRGHAYDEENTYVKPQGHRSCRKCQQVSNRISKLRAKRRKGEAADRLSLILSPESDEEERS